MSSEVKKDVEKKKVEKNCKSSGDEENEEEAIYILLKSHLPENRQALHESSVNLDKIADYCEANYFQNPHQSEALNLTKSYTQRALASIASQIFTYASNISAAVNLLEQQMDSLQSQTHYVGARLQLHREKNDRRDIGKLTRPKHVSSQPPIIYPVEKPKPPKKMSYVHESIDYSVLDGIGIGAKVYEGKARGSGGSGDRWMPHVKSATLRPSKSSNLANIAPDGVYGRTPAPTMRPPTPPTTGHFSTLTRGGKEYRSLHAPRPPPVIAPPTLPSNYAKSEVTKSTQPSTTQQPTLPAETNNQISNHRSNQSQSQSINQTNQPNQSSEKQQEKLTQPAKKSVKISNNPFETEGDESMDGEEESDRMPYNWVPPNYIEKVVAIYDYSADKDDELSFQENAVIYVVRKNEDGWWEGVLNGITGLFPGNYVEPCM